MRVVKLSDDAYILIHRMLADAENQRKWYAENEDAYNEAYNAYTHNCKVRRWKSKG